MGTFNKIIPAIVLVALAGCTMPPREYRPSPWTTVAFDQAKAQCSAQMDRDMERTEKLQSAFNMMMDTGSRVESCLRGYGYIGVR
jgi:hypothetical protein